MASKKHILGRVQVTRECNQNCVFCSAPPATKDRTLEEIKEKIDELKELGTTDLMVTGGEATLRKDIVEIIKYCKEKKFPEITIQTNGSNLDNYDFLKRINDIFQVKYNISCHASDPEIYEAIARENNMERLHKGLKNIGKLGIFAYFTIVISSLNYKHMPEHVKFIHENFPFVKHYSFNFIDPTNMAMTNKWTIPKYAETEKDIYEMVRYLKKHRISFRMERVPLCYMHGFEEFSSDIRRDVFDEKRIISFLKAEGDEDVEELNIEHSSNFHYAEQCNICKLKGLCAGINPNYVKVHGDSEVFPVFDDPYEITQRVKSSRDTLSHDKLNKVQEDLKIFKYAIANKPNKNNVYDTYSYYLMDECKERDEDFIIDGWKTHVEQINNKETSDLLSFYLHTPYCESNCSYCCYPSTTAKNPDEIEKYVAYLEEQIDKYAPIFKGQKFNTFYAGGGTPSIFTESQLKRLMDKIFTNFDFVEYSEKSIELNPLSTNLEKLKILESYGFNKLSIGVQSLAKRVLDLNERSYQTKEMIKKVVDDFHTLDLNYLNVDLLLGLNGDTPDDFLESLDKVMAMGPTNICVYPLKANDAYIEKNFGTFEKFKEFYYPLFDEVVKRVNKVAKKNSYLSNVNPDRVSYIAPLVFSKPNQKSKRVDYQYTHFNLPPYSNFCLGYYAHSRIINKFDYIFIDKKKQNSLFLKDFSTDPKDFTYMTYPLAPIFEKVKFIVKSFYIDWEVSRKKYYDFYKTDIVEDFPYAIDALIRLNIIKVKMDRVIFRKMDEKKIYPYLLFFVGRENVMKKINPKE